MAESAEKRLWIYPECWPGWADHLRVGGGLFDDGSTLLSVLDGCWRHFHQQSTPSLTTHTRLRIWLQDDAWPQWKPHLQLLKERFQPRVNNERIQFEWAHIPPHIAAPRGLHTPRDFGFELLNPLRQQLKCCFYLGQERIGSVSLGEIDLRGDQCQLTIHRRLGLTRSSTIQKCYLNSPLHNIIPKTMLEDLRYLGWTFQFSQPKGTPAIIFQKIPNVGYLESGEFLLKEGVTLQVGESIDFYHGEREGHKEEALRCRLVVLPEEVVPEPPQLEALELFLHQHPEQPDLLEAKAWVRSVDLVDDQMQLSIENQPNTIQFQGGRRLEGDLLFYHTLAEGFHNLQPNQALPCHALGTNHHGLSFDPSPTKVHLHKAVNPQYLGPSIIQKEQLQRPWELRIALQGPPPYPDFALTDFTLWLTASPHPPIQIPLASVSQNTLLFRYLPRSIHLQLPLETLCAAETLKLSLEQKQDPLRPLFATQWCVSSALQRPDVPLQTLRVVDFDTRSRLLPEGQTITFPAQNEIVLEGHRLQLTRDLTAPSPNNDDDEQWQLLLLEPRSGRRRLTLVYQTPGWMHIAARPSHNAPPLSIDVRALWLSCGDTDQMIQDPKERNPEGGPCLAFGLGFGQTNEMAQIRPSAEGFRLYRHRQHIPVFLDGQRLPPEPHGAAQGTLLPPTQRRGWLLIEHALLEYEYNAQLQLELTLLGYLFKQDSASKTLAITSGESGDFAQLDPRIPHIHLPAKGNPTRLLLSGLSRPPRGILPRLLLQENQLERPLPQELALGKIYQRGPLKLAFWELRQQKTNPDAQPAHADPTLLLDLHEKYGRKRFHLSTSFGRLGVWSQGSAFLPGAGAPRPLFAPDHERWREDQPPIPPGELIVGSDITKADLVIPGFFLPPAPLLFSISVQDGLLAIRPLSPLCQVQLVPQNDGRLLCREDPNAIDPFEAKFDPSGRMHLRCGQLLFELSTRDQDREEFHQTTCLLSIRGVFQPAHQDFVIGGPAHQTPLPILDPIPQSSPEEVLYTIFSPDLQLRAQGKGLVGLRHATNQSSLFEQLHHDIELSTLPTQPDNTPLDALYRLHPGYRTPIADPEPPTSRQVEEAPLPPAFFGAQEELCWGPLRLKMHARTREDGHPTIDRVPSWLSLTPPTFIALQFTEGGDGFLHPDGTPLDQLIFGRLDPQRPQETTQVGDSELVLSTPFEQDGVQTAKISLFGYAPRRVASITRFQGKLKLEVPAPQSPGGYHLVLDGAPCYETRTVPITQPLHFHINHLFHCVLEPQDDCLVFRLLGYLLGNQQNPSLPILLNQSNGIGCIHLHSGPQELELQLSPGLCPAHLAVLKDGRLHRHAASLPLSDGESIALVSPEKLQENQPAGMDRLLWFFQEQEDAGLLWDPASTLSPTTSALDEGSSFAFFAPATPTQKTPPKAPLPPSNIPPQDEGSSFGFGPAPHITQEIHERDILDVRPITSTPASQTDELSSPHPSQTDELFSPPPTEGTGLVLALGWFGFDNPPPHHFGYFGVHDGPQAHITRQHGNWWATPASYQAEPSLLNQPALLRRGQLHWLEGTTVLKDGDILTCGTAAFTLQVTPGAPTIRVSRRWLWLPSQQTLRLSGDRAALQDRRDRELVVLSHSSWKESIWLIPKQRGYHLEPKNGALPEIFFAKENTPPSSSVEEPYPFIQEPTKRAEPTT